MSVVLFLAVLFVLILVHEWGHFIVAKKTGMRVDEFGIGFPPKLFGLKKGETEYTFNLLPIGGFVRILGENGSDETALQSDEYARSFSARPRWAQALVLVAGVAMNILFAWVLFVLVLLVGVPTSVDEATASEAAELVVTEVVSDLPAALAGLPTGARLTDVTAPDAAVDQLTPTAVTEFISARPGVPLTFSYQSGDVVEQVSVTPAVGIPDTSTPVVGIRLALVETVSQPLGTALVAATTRTLDTLVAITVGLSVLIKDAVVGQADLSAVAGPIGIVGLVGDAAEFGFTSLLVFTAIISLNLAVINMLPVPALDGGRLLFVAVESVLRRPINPEWMARVNFAGFALLIFLMIAVTYSDILKLL